jgi:hypothetical protein
MSKSSHKTSEERTCAKQTSPTSIVSPSTGNVADLKQAVTDIDECAVNGERAYRAMRESNVGD